MKLSHDSVDQDNTGYKSGEYFMNDPTPRLGAPSTVVIQAIRGILKPLVRFMLAQGLTYTILIDLLKSIYVEVALSEFKLEKKRQTDSRVSLLTGVHRKDVKRLSEMLEADAPPPENVTVPPFVRFPRNRKRASWPVMWPVPV